MTIPKYDELMPHILAELDEPGVDTLSRKLLEAPLAKRFGLEEDELAAEYESGNGRIFPDRISWALSHLAIAELVERPRRGVCRITELGRSMVGQSDQVRSHVKARMAERDAERKSARADRAVVQSDAVVDSEITPDEALNQAAQAIRETVCDDLLDTILSKKPVEFEKLVVKLLDKMGYGGMVENAAQVTQYSNDGGIDGIIREDVLGLGRIHVQAKRYKRDNTIGREDIQKFVGALAVAQSNKGVFITTSSFSKGAVEYVDSLNGSTNIVLIDGHKLVEYIYDFGLGMQTEQTVVIKRMDTDFWDKMQDDERPGQ